MKKLFIAAIAVFALLNTEAQTLTTPQPSPTQTIKQNFGLSNIELSYSRPGMKGRKIFGDLVPYGKVWRTGANNATLITFADDVKIGGTLVKAGQYGLVTIPEKRNWTIILTKQQDVTSPAAYKQSEDVVRIEAKTMDMDESMETFTMQFANVKPTSTELHIMWDRTAVALPIATDVETKVMAQIDQLMNKDNKPYFSAAMYYMESGKDLNQALAWFDKGVEMQPAAFWIHHQRANCLAKLGKKEEAKAAAERSKTLAAEQKNDDYVKLNEKLLAELATN
jgi:tetratricopeptide (TPR) repeat protein